MRAPAVRSNRDSARAYCTAAAMTRASASADQYGHRPARTSKSQTKPAAIAAHVAASRRRTRSSRTTSPASLRLARTLTAAPYVRELRDGPAHLAGDLAERREPLLERRVVHEELGGALLHGGRDDEE